MSMKKYSQIKNWWNSSRGKKRLQILPHEKIYETDNWHEDRCEAWAQ